MASLVVQAVTETKFKTVKKTKFLTGNWRKKYEPLMVKVLTANLFDCDYPNVQLELTIESNALITMEVVNTETQDKMSVLWPKLEEDGELGFYNVSYSIKVASGRMWTLCFMDGTFSAGTPEFKNRFSSRDGIDVSGSFTNFDALDKNYLIRILLNKLDVFFDVKNTFTPEGIIDMLCQALCVKSKEFKRMSISMGYCNILEIKDSEIRQAVECTDEYTLQLDFQNKTTYEEAGFSLCEESRSQRYSMNYDKHFTDTECLAKRIEERASNAKAIIKDFLHGIALYNENIKK